MATTAVPHETDRSADTAADLADGLDATAAPLLSVLEARDVLELLAHGALEIDGRLVDSSNNAMVGSVSLGGESMRCVYKPMRGERPLWDFPDGQLARREVAAFMVAEAAAWHCVPPTTFRNGPFGPGMVQQWIDGADGSRVADLFPAGTEPDGWMPILQARADDGTDLVLAHANAPILAALALFDAVTNNADRKASHLLATPDGKILGVDHGLTFNHEPKLRTILWGWAGSPIPPELLAGLDRLVVALLDGELAAQLHEHLTITEVRGFTERVSALRQAPRFPLPPQDRTAIPWPPL